MARNCLAQEAKSPSGSSVVAAGKRRMQTLRKLPTIMPKTKTKEAMIASGTGELCHRVRRGASKERVSR